MTVFHNLCRDYHEITAPPLDCVCTIWLFARDLPSRHKREDFIITTQTAVSTMLGQVFTQTELIVLPSHQQHLQLLRPQATPVPPASAGPSLRETHTNSIRIPRSGLDLGYPAWCSSSFHLASPRSILVGLLLLTASSEMEIPDGTPDNTVKTEMTLPTEIQNQPFVSHTFPFQIDTRLSLAASTAPPPSVSPNSMNSVVVERANQSSSTPSLARCVLQAGSQTPMNHAIYPQPMQPRKSRIQTMHAANSTSRGHFHA